MVIGAISVTTGHLCGGLNQPAFATKVGAYVDWVKTKANIKSANRLAACGLPIG